jgi:MFS family permease
VTLLSRYDALLRGTGAASPLAAGLVGRLSLGTTGLALLLLVRESTGSYAAAGAVAAAYAITFACFSPIRARRADRDGPRGVLLVCGLAHPAALVTLVLLASVEAGVVVLLAAAVLAGATVPPISGVVRALWRTLVPPELMTTAYSLDAVLVELCFVGGPLIVAVLTAVAGPSAAVLAAAALVLVGSTWLRSTTAVRAVTPYEHPAGGSWAGPLSSPGVRALLVVVASVGAGFGALEVALPAYAEAQGGTPSTAGVLLAVWSVGSILGGLAYGAVHSPVPHARQRPWLVGALALGSGLPLLATGTVAMGALLVLYGLTVAPYITCNSVLLGRAAPAGTVTEAFAWSGSMIFGGAALGNVAAGLLVEHASVTAALLLTAATGLLGLAGTATGWRVLQSL